MSDDRDGDDASDWLSAQFGSHGGVDENATPDAAKPDKFAKPIDGAGSTSATEPGEEASAGAGTGDGDGDGDGDGVSPAWPLSLSEEPAAPASASGSGFTWGLTPTNAADPTRPDSPVATEPPAGATPAATPEPVSVPEPVPEPVQDLEPAPRPEPVQPPAPVARSQLPPFAPPSLVQPGPMPPATSGFAPPLATPPVTPPVPSFTPPVTSPVSSFMPPSIVPPVIPPVVVPPVEGAFVPPAAPPVAPAGWPFAPRPHEETPAGDCEVSTGEASGSPTAGSEPLPFDAALAGGPSVDAEPPTMALPWEGPTTEMFAPPMASAPVAEPATELLGGFGPAATDAAAGSSADGSSIDALFEATQFREYETGQVATSESSARPAVKTSAALLPRQPKVLLWIAGSLAALLVLVGLFFLGTKLPRLSAAPVVAVTPTASAKPTPSPTPTVLPVGPLPAGSYKWDRLLGGECLSPFTSPWEEKFTVVDCGTPHPAQLVARGVFAETPPAVTDPAAPATPAVGGPASSYPGVDALQAQINLLCTTPSVIDFAAAGAYSNIQILGSYPASARQWADGERSYFCFVTRSSGEQITGSLTVPHAP